MVVNCGSATPIRLDARFPYTPSAKEEAIVSSVEAEVLEMFMWEGLSLDQIADFYIGLSSRRGARPTLTYRAANYAIEFLRTDNPTGRW